MNYQVDEQVSKICSMKMDQWKTCLLYEKKIDRMIHERLVSLEGSDGEMLKMIKRTLQVKVLYSFDPNVVTPQPHTGDSSTFGGMAQTGEDASLPQTRGQWTVRIEGMVCNNHEVVVDLDSSMYPDASLEWFGYRAKEHSDGFVVSRPGNQPFRIRIKLLRHYSPERFQFSEALARAISPYLGGQSDETKQNVVMAVWGYIKDNNLLKENDCRVVVCDSTLREIFGRDSLQYSELMASVEAHLLPIQPVVLEFDLRMKKEVKDVLLGEYVFDVEVESDEVLQDWRREHYKKAIQIKEESQKEMEVVAEKELDLVCRINQLAQDHKWLSQFAEDPYNFTKDLINSQTADLRILSNEYESETVHEMNAEEYTKPWVNDAINVIYARPRS